MNPVIRERILQRISLPNPAGCMEWNGALSTSGYGRYSNREGFWQGHRAAYEIFVGPIPAGLVIDHLCRNRRCCNPVHLEPVTSAENTRRGWPATKTHCARGHEFTPENTYRRQIPGTGVRMCRACNRDAAARYKARRKELQAV